MVVHIARRFNYWGGHGQGGGLRMGFTPSTNININLGGRYPNVGGMFNFNGYMAPPPRPRTGFERFCDGLGRAMKSLAPIAAGVAGIFALFGKNGILKSDGVENDDKNNEDKLKADKAKYEELLAKEKDGTLTDQADIDELARLRKEHPEFDLQTKLDEANAAKEQAEKENADLKKENADLEKNQQKTNNEAKEPPTVEEPEVKTKSPKTKNANSANKSNNNSTVAPPKSAEEFDKNQKADAEKTKNSVKNVYTGKSVDLNKEYTVSMVISRDWRREADAYVVAPDGKIYSASVDAGNNNKQINELANKIMAKLKKAGFTNITIQDVPSGYTSDKNKTADESNAWNNIEKTSQSKVDKNKAYKLYIRFNIHPGSGNTGSAAVSLPNGELYYANTGTSLSKSRAKEDLARQLYDELTAQGWKNITIVGYNGFTYPTNS